MRETKSKDFATVLAVAKSLNQGALDDVEVEKIARSVLKYNLADNNHVGAGVSNWNWVKKPKEEVMATRRERALLNAEKREREARNKVINCVTGLMSSEYKKKSGAWHIGKIAKDVNLTEKTVSKHLKAYLAED